VSESSHVYSGGHHSQRNENDEDKDETMIELDVLTFVSTVKRYQINATQHNTTQHNTTQHNTTQRVSSSKGIANEASH